MEAVTKVSQNMQTYVPVMAQKSLGLKAKEELVWTVVDGFIRLERRRIKKIDFLEVAAKLRKKIKNPRSVLEAREAMEKNYSRF